MALQKVEKLQWAGFCKQMSRVLIGKRALMEIASPEWGVQIETRWVPVLGFVYDPRSDLIEIVLEGIDHIAVHPREFYVDYGVSGIESLGILDQDSAWQIVLLRDPLMLPPPRR